MSTILRSSLPLLAALAFALTAIADDGAPLQLGSEHLGMTSEGIADVEQEAATEQVVDEAIQKSEWSDEDLGIEEPGCVCPADETIAPTDVETRAEGVTDYDSCVEVAIRAGNGFKAASSVCQALFPEPLAIGGGAQDLSATTTSY